MVRQEFDAVIENLGAFYERKVKPIPRTLEMWFEKVKNIPSEAVGPIQDKIMDECEYWPRNLPATLWAMYHTWLEAHPEKRAHRTEIDCPDCESGWLTLQKIVLNKFGKSMYRTAIPTFAWPCGKCRQLPSKQYRTLFQAIEAGYERVDLERHTAPKLSIAQMVGGIGKPIPPPHKGVYFD